MHTHRCGEAVNDGHPLNTGLVSYLRKHVVQPSCVNFLANRICFVYPKTLWLRLAADTPDDVRLRQELEVQVVGDLISKWLREISRFPRVVLDLRNVTIVDVGHLRGFLSSLTKGTPNTYYLVDTSASIVMSRLLNLSESMIYTDEPKVISAIRQSLAESFATVSFPRRVDVLSMDSVLREQLSRRRMTGCDAVIFDCQHVGAMDFGATAMLTPLVHSLAHKYGVLAKFINIPGRLAKMLERFGALRPISSFLLSGCAGIDEPVRSDNRAMPLTAFTSDELFNIQVKFLNSFDGMVRDDINWFMRTLGLSKRSRPWTIDKMGNMVVVFRQLVKELVENVALHAYGIGYAMLELHPVTGMSIFVGDVGIGLARGISHVYRVRVRGDEQAVSMVMGLKNLMSKRRRPLGALAYGGRGLERVRYILGKLEGTALVRSGTSMALYQPKHASDPTNIYHRLFAMCGTQILINIPS